MWLQLGNCVTKVVKATGEESKWLRSYLTFKDANAHFRKRPDLAQMKLYDLVDKVFPTGLLPIVMKAAKAEKIDIQWVDNRPKPCEPAPNDTELAWLRDYQRAAVDKVVERGRGILWCPTGSGKTEIAIGIVRAIPTKWLFIVHRAQLLHEAAERYEKRQAEHYDSGIRYQAGRVGDGAATIGDQFTTATFQTLYKMNPTKREKFLANFGGIIVDECHTLPADSFWKVAMETRGSYFRVGMSGTPLARGDRRSVLAIAALGPVIYRIKPDLLIERGVLSKPKIVMVPVVQRSDASTWQGVYGELVVRSSVRNRALVDSAKKAEKPCLVFVKQVNHGKELQKRMEKAGLTTGFVWGSDSTTKRRKAIQDLVRGEIEVLICSVIFQEGVDIPSLRSVIIGTGGKSTIAALQRIGRGMRMSEGKDEFQVFDIQDRGNKWLEKHTRARLRSYAGEGYEVTIENGSLYIQKKLRNDVEAAGAIVEHELAKEKTP